MSDPRSGGRGPVPDPQAGGRRLRVGVLGCAGIAERRMLPSMAYQPLVEIAAVASRDGARAEAFAARFGGEPVTGYDRLLEREDVDAVYLPLPPELHVEWTIRALEAGKHVLCEKPFATGRAEAAEAVAAARERRLLLMESFMFLHHPQHAEVARLLADGVIGELRLFHGYFGIPRAGTEADAAPRYASTLPEVAAYPLRAARLFLGDGLRVCGAELRRTERDARPIAGSALLVSSRGVPAHLVFGVDHSYRSGYAMWGSEGHLRLDRAYSTPDEHAPVVRIERQDGVEEVPLPCERQFTRIAGEFARTILDGGDFERHGEDILRQAELVDAVDRAAAAARS
ncbi:oxidoreductase [Streptomyces humidus]|uniref:Oxidoreductase n=1 Tax=Streptomyces humidus TaxID=52259 RepID=A0A918FZL9_9ACTN|nr:Gfo/Idh/MocA family oxidoreductase [Streptomyces humidus]GGS05591.1 oxidoreductase [Streptomyces humidus]